MIHTINSCNEKNIHANIKGKKIGSYFLSEHVYWKYKVSASIRLIMLKIYSDADTNINSLAKQALRIESVEDYRDVK